MESILPLCQQEMLQPKYRVGKIKNKYLIIEIYAYVYQREEVMFRLFKTDQSLRTLVV